MTHPNPTATGRLEGIALTARQRYTAIPSATRNFLGGYFVLVVGFVIAGLLARVAAVDLWRDELGPLVWDAAHGDRDAFLTLGVVIIGLAVFVYFVRAAMRLARPLFERSRTDNRSDYPDRVLSGGPANPYLSSQD